MRGHRRWFASSRTLASASSPRWSRKPLAAQRAPLWRAARPQAETAARHGEEQVQIWHRSYDIPALPRDDPSHPRFDPRYTEATALDLAPDAESLLDTLGRVLPC